LENCQKGVGRFQVFFSAGQLRKAPDWSADSALDRASETYGIILLAIKLTDFKDETVSAMIKD
jgi:hypothetical protein